MLEWHTNIFILLAIQQKVWVSNFFMFQSMLSEEQLFTVTLRVINEWIYTLYSYTAVHSYWLLYIYINKYG